MRQNYKNNRGGGQIIPYIELSDFIKKNSAAVLVIAIKKEEIISDVYQMVEKYGWEEKNIYCYVPENVDERKKRIAKMVMPDREGVRIMETLINGREPFFSPDGVR